MTNKESINWHRFRNKVAELKAENDYSTVGNMFISSVLLGIYYLEDIVINGEKLEDVFNEMIKTINKSESKVVA